MDSFRNDEIDILIIDDTQIYLELVSKTLDKEGYKTHVAKDAVSALNTLNKEHIDLVLLDIVMPHIDGFELCEIIKTEEKFSDIPIIFITASKSVIIEEKALNSGGLDFITKPFSPKILLSRVKIHLQLRKNKEALLEKNKELEEINNELEAFSSTVSHDLKSPLQLIKTYSPFITDALKVCNNVQAIEDIEVIEEAGVKMAAIIDDLMKLAKVKTDQLSKTNFNLCGLIMKVYNEFDLTDHNRKHTFNCSVHKEVYADYKLLKLALTNLMSNAWKYTSKRPETNIEFGQIEKENQLIFFLKDNGAGFDSNMADKLFSAFSRFHKESDYDGTGIGLTIVKRVIEKHNGSIWIESQIDKGTTVFFTLK